jgi:hypothetical protein
MYKRYQASQVRYAYLADVRLGIALDQELEKSQWFTRGWTLQELLAPASVVFFDQDWVEIGTKASLGEIISKITGIEDLIDFESACVAQKMSWAANRETTRVEDMAYCLLGLFDVNMPPLYGEGEKAFIRLQLEILKTSDDESIFAWEDSSSDGHSASVGILAKSPQNFLGSRDLTPLQRKDRKIDVFSGNSGPFSMTNKGLHIILPLITIQNFGKVLYLAPLKCCWIDKKGNAEEYPTILLEKENEGNDSYRRVSAFLNLSVQPPVEAIYTGGLLRLSYFQIQDAIRLSDGLVKNYLYVKEANRGGRSELSTRFQSCPFSITAPSLSDHGFEVTERAPRNLIWEDSTKHEIGMFLRCARGVVAGVKFVNKISGESIVLAIIWKTGRPPGVLLATLTPNSNMALDDIRRTLYKLCIEPASNTGGTSLDGSNSTADSTAAVKDQLLSSSVYEAEQFHGKMPPLDRISRELGNGKSVSASLKHEITEDGVKCFIISMDIDLGGRLPWPAPSWTEELLLSLETKKAKVDEQNLGNQTFEEIEMRHPRGNREATNSGSESGGFEKRRRERRNAKHEDVRHGARERSVEDPMMERAGKPDYGREERREYRWSDSQTDRPEYGQENERRSKNYGQHDSSRRDSASEKRHEGYRTKGRVELSDRRWIRRDER